MKVVVVLKPSVSISSLSMSSLSTSGIEKLFYFQAIKKIISLVI
jgi:hypothetical protein